jgi:hypothetical protein
MRMILVCSTIGVCASVSFELLAQQASFGLENSSPVDGVYAPVYDWTGALLWGSDWRVELYGGATGSSLTPAVQFGTTEEFIGQLVAPGYFMVRPPSGDLVIPSVPGYGWAWLQVKVCDVQLGATYEQALARNQGGYGQSTLFYAQGGYAGGTLPSLPMPLIGLTSFTVLQPVPEPASWALLAVGLGGLVWCRRH